EFQRAGAQGNEGLISGSGGSSSSGGGGYYGVIPGGEATPHGFSGSDSVKKKDREDKDTVQREGEPTDRRHLYATRAGKGKDRRTAGTRVGRQKSQRPRTIDDVKMSGLPKGMPVTTKKDWEKWDQMPPKFKETLAGLLSPRQKELMNFHGILKRDGMSLEEYNAKKNVSDVMYFVQASQRGKMDPKRRAEVLLKSREKLRDYGYLLQMQLNYPDEMYATMGVPESYVRESREGSARALERVEAALKVIKNIEDGKQ
ncbi:MAG: hypothetical protein OXT65_10640, partial [Alphaproteobacteria bacterium]|nr:hypothetical protein [Alphaproteobacteria bacterium]